jgi:hypothetical protein
MSRPWQQDPTEIPNRIEIFLAVPGKEPSLCTVDQLTIHGASVTMPKESAIQLGIGGAVELLITDIPTGTSVVIPAATERRGDKDDSRTYRVRFTDANAVAGLLHPELVRLFDRRESYRALPDAKKPIQVTIQPPPGCSADVLMTNLVDLSTTGLALDVPVDFESEMILFDFLSFSLDLGQGQEEFVGFIRHRSWKEVDSVRYGIEFSARTEDLESKRDRVSTWVLRRQLTLKRSAA